jgi:hypothetical protein
MPNGAAQESNLPSVGLRRRSNPNVDAVHTYSSRCSLVEASVFVAEAELHPGSAVSLESINP